MQGAQAEQATARAANLALAEQQQDLLADIAKQKSSRLLTMTEKEVLAASNPDFDVDLPWQIDQAGEYSIAGGRPPVPLVDMGVNTLEKEAVTALVAPLVESYQGARNATKNIRKIDETLTLLEKGDVDTGFGADFRQNIRRAFIPFRAARLLAALMSANSFKCSSCLSLSALINSNNVKSKLASPVLGGLLIHISAYLPS